MAAGPAAAPESVTIRPADDEPTTRGGRFGGHDLSAAVPVSQLSPAGGRPSAEGRRPPPEGRAARRSAARSGHESRGGRGGGGDRTGGGGAASGTRVAALVAALAAVLLVLVALVWTASRPAAPAPDSASAALTVAGAQAPDAAEVDLAKPIEVGGVDPAGAGGSGAAQVSLALSVAGVALGAPTSVTSLDAAAGTPWSTTLTPPSWVRYVAGGAIRGEIEVTRGGATAARGVVIEPAQPALATAMGGGSILVVLFALAYLESARRSIVAGHLRHAGTAVAAFVGVPLGAGVWLAVATFTRHEPALGAGVACALLGAVLAVFGTMFSVHLARRG
jgi:serine/threonine-protein kinase